ncbi:MAG TPA: hypothetical protein VIN67_04590 [Desulfobaccales bacterium]
MKRLSLFLLIAMLLAGVAVGGISTPSDAQRYPIYNYPPPPRVAYATPWVGANTPWTYYNGDWFLKGMLYYFFGPRYGWAPYYAYAPTYVVRPNTWYGPKWNAWYQRNPHYWDSFRRHYPYWSGHKYGHHYDRKFYEEHHHGQGGGWHKGFQHGRN